VEDVHFHPVEPRQVRTSIVWASSRFESLDQEDP
jgi:hypothetical protein